MNKHLSVLNRRLAEILSKEMDAWACVCVWLTFLWCLSQSRRSYTCTKRQWVVLLTHYNLLLQHLQSILHPIQLGLHCVAQLWLNSHLMWCRQFMCNHVTLDVHYIIHNYRLQSTSIISFAKKWHFGSCQTELGFTNQIDALLNLTAISCDLDELTYQH